MSTQLFLSVAGAAIGGAIGGPAGAQAGWVAGSLAGAVLFPPKMPDGPRMGDLRVQTSSYGVAIPRVWGMARTSGNVIWAADLVEHEHEAGGKGGGSGGSYYTYTCSFAVAICEGPIAGVRRIWADGILIHDVSSTNNGQQSIFDNLINSINSGGGVSDGLMVYPGTETQTVDPTMQAALGDVPAHRGLAYAVFTDLPLEKYGNRIPNVTFEVVEVGSIPDRLSEVIMPGSYGADLWVNPMTGYVWVTSLTNVLVIDPVAQVIVQTIVLPGGNIRSFEYAKETGAVWCSTGSKVYVVDAIGGGLRRTITTAGTGWDILIGYNPIRQTMLFGSGSLSYPGIQEYSASFYSQINYITSPSAFYGNCFVVRAVSKLYIRAYGSLWVLNATDNSKLAYFSTGTILDAPEKFCYDEVNKKVYVLADYSVTGQILVIDIYSNIGTYVLLDALGTFSGIHYHAASNSLICSYTLSPTFAVYNASDYSFRMNRIGDPDAPGAFDGLFKMVEPLNYTDRLYSVNDNGLYRIYLSDVLAPTAITVSSVLADLSVSSGLASGEIDVTDVTDVCRGFVLGQQGSARGAIETLMMAYQFDAVQSGSVLKFRKRGRAPVATLTLDELAVHDPGSATPSPLVLSRADEVTLPKVVNVTFTNYGTDYQPGSQSSRRLVGNARAEISTQLAVVMTDVEAKALADAALYSAWTARTTTSWTTSLAHADLEPTDVVTIDGNAIRITKRSLRGTTLQFDGNFDSGQILAFGAATSNAPSVSQSVATRFPPTVMYLLDIAMIKDTDNDAGMYVVTAGATGWPGAVVFKSSDGGASYAEVVNNSAGSAGSAQSVLADFSGNIFDEFSTVDVALLSGNLSSTTELAVLNGANVALVGNEILQYKTATLNANGSYTLSGLLRGRRGTPTTGHVAGDRFVLLSSNTKRITGLTAELNLARLYKGVTFSGSVNAADAVSFTNTGQGLECLAPVLLGAGRDAAGNVTLQWVRQTRIGAEWRDVVDVALGESTEAYEIDIFDATFTTLKRTLTTSSPTVAYSAALQVTDFGSAQAVIYVRIYQLSATVGRGAVLQGNL